MINIVLYNPQIPPNTGNIMRLCANTGFSLHIIEPSGFPLDDKSLKRAKLDYFSDINPIIYKNYKSFIDAIDEKKIYAVTKFGTRIYVSFKEFKKQSVPLKSHNFVFLNHHFKRQLNILYLCSAYFV